MANNTDKERVFIMQTYDHQVADLVNKVDAIIADNKVIVGAHFRPNGRDFADLYFEVMDFPEKFQGAGI